ncbi:hypothetical protein [Chitinophaga eiseniae]|uniref:Uncharacterized protein n=1 Tax=Chitinophaga eiseniae TaxID=634771 RepID=A0A847SWC0_9BACT|nr:hypothetical protein [Chitinophaga eiseniae]NLR82479.1 hypothetical protein [Chitinophaga eiseniae]
MNKVAKIFAERALERGGLYLYSRNDAMECILACQAEKIHLLGIDGFRLTADTIQPSMNDSVDFSSSFFEGDIYEYALASLEKRPEELFFEIVFE